MSAEPRSRVLIAGAGIAALEALLALRHLAGDRLELDLIAPTREFVYAPMSVLEPFQPGVTPRLPLRAMARERGAGHVCDAVEAVDAERRIVRARSGAEYGWDVLLLAAGARRKEAVPGALTYAPQAAARLRGVLDEAVRGEIGRLAFAVPSRSAWALPLYELALLAAGWLEERRAHGARMTLVTPEHAPLEAFGERASAAVGDMLERAAIRFHGAAQPDRVVDGHLQLADGAAVAADFVVALPRLCGPALQGVPADRDGFVPVDEHGRVAGLERVYAAGDMTDSALKQGGLAAQQADAAAAAIARWAGAAVRPAPFRPVLRGVLLNGDEPAFLRSDTRGDRRRSLARESPLWWPPAKVAGRYLGPYLAARGVSLPAGDVAPPTAAVW